MRADVERAAVRGAGVGRLADADLCAAGRITDLAVEEAADDGFTVDVTLAPAG
jgi:valyl-tRNA synthetase